MLYLHGVGHFFPDNIMSNEFLESLNIGVTAEWILELSGIKNRRTVMPLEYLRSTGNRDLRQSLEVAQYSNAQTGRLAAEMALCRSGIEAKDIGWVIVGGSCPDYFVPAVACAVSESLGISVPSIDINAACTTFGAHINFLSMMNPEKLPDYILTIQPEHTTLGMNYFEKNEAMFMGDGTTAQVISARVPSRVKIISTSYGSHPASWQKVVASRSKHFRQDGRAVQNFAIRRIRDEIKRISGDSSLNINLNDCKFIGHQTNLHFLNLISEHCHIKPENHLHNVEEYGNTGTAGAPSVLSQNWENFADGTKMMITVVGAGLSWSSLVLNFGEGS